MFITIYCPLCGIPLEVDDSELGMRGDCPDCRGRFVVRAPSAASAAAAAADGRQTQRVIMVDDAGNEIPVAQPESAASADGAAASDSELDEIFDADIDFDAEADRAAAAAVPMAHPVSTQELAAAADVNGADPDPSVPVAEPVYAEDAAVEDDESRETVEQAQVPEAEPHNPPAPAAPKIAAPATDPVGKKGQPLLEAGDRIAGFEVGPLLGSGSMGQVYLARQVSMDREVALKILPRDIMSRDDEAVQQFLNEVRMLAKLDHPNIVTAFEAGQYEDIHYLAMSCVNGESLEQRQRREPVLPEMEALQFCAEVARALEHAWTRFRLLHRDIKPANIMIDGMGEVKLMDMGIAKISTDEDGATAIVMGTPYYMSPEQATGKAGLDWRSDQYSLGATIFHLLTGRPPFTGDSSMDIMTKQAFEPLTPPRQINPAMTEETDRLIRRMMAKDPDKRYADWAEVIHEMEAIIEKLRARRRRKGSQPREEPEVDPSPAAKPRTRANMAPPRRAARRRYAPPRRGPGLGVHIAGFLAVLVVIYLIIGFVNRSGAFEPYRLPQGMFPPFLRVVDQ